MSAEKGEIILYFSGREIILLKTFNNVIKRGGFEKMSNTVKLGMIGLGARAETLLATIFALKEQNHEILLCKIYCCATN